MLAISMNVSTLFSIHTKKCSQKSSKKRAHLAVVENLWFNITVCTFGRSWNCDIFDTVINSSLTPYASIALFCLYLSCEYVYCYIYII